MSEIITTIDLEDEDGLYNGEGGTEAAGSFDYEHFELYPNPDDNQSAESNSEGGRFAANSIEEAVELADIDPEEWSKIAESTGGDVLQKESEGRQWLYKDSGGEKTSLTESQSVGERHQEIVNGLYEQGYYVSEYQKPDSNTLVREVYFADEKGHISYQIFERELETKADIEEQPQPIIDDGDGLDSTAELAEVAVAYGNENELNIPEIEPNTGIAIAQAEVTIELPEQEPAPEPQIETLIDLPPVSAEAADALRGELDDLELSFSETDRAAAERQRAIAESLDNLNISRDTLVTAKTLEQHKLVDAKGYEVQTLEIEPIQIQNENEKSDLLELTRNEGEERVVMAYMEDANRYMEVSISPDAENGLTTIENPTVADIRMELERFREDLREREIYGPGGMEGYLAERRTILREKVEEEEEERQIQEQNQRLERRRVFIEEEEEDEEFYRALKAVEAAAGVGIAETGDKEIKDRGNDRPALVIQEMNDSMRALHMEKHEVRIQSEHLREREIRQIQDTGQNQTVHAIASLERATGIMIARAETKHEEQDTPGPEPIIPINPQTPNPPNPIQNSRVQIRAVVSPAPRDEGAIVETPLEVVSEIRGIENETGIQLFPAETADERAVEASPVEVSAETRQNQMVTATPVPGDEEVGAEVEYVGPGGFGIELAA